MTASRTNSAPFELLVPLVRSGGPALHHQLEAAIRDAVRDGRLRQGTALPSTRRLAEHLGVSRGVAVEAYQQLVAEGYLLSRGGGYTEVHAAPTSAATPTATERAQPRFDLLYGRPDVSQFPRAAWLRSVRRVLNEAPNERLIYLDGRGAPEMRSALADYLNRVRGTWALPDNVVICNGFAQAWALVLRTLADLGVTRIAVEDPSFEDIRTVAERAGLTVVGIPVDQNGVSVSMIEAADVGAVLLTPAHQLTGAVLAPERRTALLDWARRHGTWVIEDDYDAEHRYDHAPVGAMQGLAPDHVIHCGSGSKTLAPGLRLGWVVAPRRLADALAEAKIDADRGSPVVDQLVFADFLERGEYDRHLRRMRPVYRVRRDALLAALARHLPDFEPTGISAGLHLMAWLPPDLDEAAVVAAAATRGIGITPLGPHRMSPGRGAIVFGYAKENERTLTAGIELLAEVVAGLR